MSASTHGSADSGYEVWAQAFQAHTGRRPRRDVFLLVCLWAHQDPELEATRLAEHLGWPDSWF